MCKKKMKWWNDFFTVLTEKIIWFQLHTQLFDFNYTHNYLISTTHTIIWFQLHTQLFDFNYRYLHGYVFLIWKKLPFLSKIRSWEKQNISFSQFHYWLQNRFWKFCLTYHTDIFRIRHIFSNLDFHLHEPGNKKIKYHENEYTWRNRHARQK